MKNTLILILLFFLLSNFQIFADMNYSVDTLKSSENIILIIDPSTNKIINFSAGAKTFYGYSDFSNIDIRDINALPAYDIEKEMNNAKKEKRNYFHFKHFLSDGSIKDVQVSPYPMSLDDKEILFLNVRDISKEVQTENSLKTAAKMIISFLLISTLFTAFLLKKVYSKSKKYQDLFENMVEGFAVHEMIYDKNGKPFDYRYIDINPYFEKLTGLKRKTTIGRTVKELLAEIEDYWIQSFGEVAKTGEPMFFTNYSKDLDKHFECYAFSPSKNKFAVVFTDVTDRVKSQNKVEKYQQLQLNLTNHIIISLTGLLEQHDPYTKNHSENVAMLSKKLAEKIELSKEKTLRVYYAGLVHDIGKTIIPGDVLRKVDRLSADEFNHIKRHPVYGYRSLSKSSELKDIADIVLHHHERWDGRGYPHQLSQEDIPIESRIITVVDAYDAMRSDRPYREAQSKEYAFEELKRNSGTQFDPDIVKAFLNLMK